MSRSDRLIERLFTPGLPAPEERELRELLRRDPKARARHDRLRALCRVAAGRAPDEPSDAELDRLAATIEPGAAPVVAVSEWRRRTRSLGRLWPAVAVAAAAAVALLLLPRQIQNSHLGLRGGPASQPSLCTIEAYAVATEAVDPSQRPRQLVPGDQLKLTDYLQFRYASADPEIRYLYLFGLDARMQPLDYYPRPDAAQSVTIEPGGEPTSLGRSIRLEKRHQPGPLRVVGLCSRAPLMRDAVLRSIGTMRAAGIGVRALDHVPLEGVTATTVLDLEVTP